MTYFILSLFVLLPVVADIYSQPSVFAYIYESPKWILLYSFASIWLLVSIFKRKKIVFVYPSVIRLPSLIYLTGFFLLWFFAPAGNRETVLLEHVLFVTLAFCFFYLLKEDKDFLEKLSWVTFLGLALLTGAILIGRIFVGERVLAFFGSPTMYGEYMGALLLLASYFVLFSKNSRQVFGIKLALVILGTVALLIIQPRAPLLAFFMALTFLLSRSNSFFKVKRSYVLATLLLGIILTVFLSLNTYKQESASIRKIRWMNTLDMILSRPLGSGLGNFAAAYGEFQNKRGFDVEAAERSIIANPHNAFLELAAESGLIVFGAFLMMLFVSVPAALRVKSPYATIYLSLLIYLAVDGFFNYPQDGPASYFLFSFAAGLFLFICGDTKIKLGIFPSNLLKGTALVVLLGFSYKIFLSEILTFKNMNNAEVLSRACKLDPQNWRACLRTVSLEWASGNKDESLRLLEALELRFPEHYIIRKKTIQILFESGNTEKGCEHLRIYDKRFNDGSSLHKFLLEKCT